MNLFFRQIVLLCVILSAVSSARAQTAPLQIIPEPRQMEASGENFSLKNAAKISLANSRSENDRFAAQDFIEDARATANARLSIGGGKILVGTLGDARIKTAFQSANLEIPANLNDEGYALIVTANRIIVGGKSEAGTFYGLQTLKQLVRGEGQSAYIQGARIVSAVGLADARQFRRRLVRSSANDVRAIRLCCRRQS